jgi:uncharacterized membrane protein
MSEGTLTSVSNSKSAAGVAFSEAVLSLRPRLVPLVLTVFAVAGLGISIYLTAAHYGNKTIVCAGLGQCDYVNSSEYASVLGIPVSMLGILMYAALLSVATLWALLYTSELLPVAYWGMALAGAGYAGYLTYVELEVLHAICIWCVASASVLTASLVISSVYVFRSGYL